VILQLDCCGVDGPRDYLHSAWFNHTTFAGGAFVPPSCCVLLNNDTRRPVFRDETQCQIEALLSDNATFGDDANVKQRGCYGVVVTRLQRYEYLTSLIYVSIVLQVTTYLCVAIGYTGCKNVTRSSAVAHCCIYL